MIDFGNGVGLGVKKNMRGGATNGTLLLKVPESLVLSPFSPRNCAALGEARAPQALLYDGAVHVHVKICSRPGLK